MSSIADIRQTYQKYELLEASVADDPHEQFGQWFEQALHSEVREPTAMTLATASPQGRPSARIVLLKGFDADGFVFYTNYESRKGLELSANPQASLLFFWPELERQVRIEGSVVRTTAEQSDAYYRSRPLGSRVGAWASAQSRPVEHQALAARVQELGASLGDDPARPPYWGGFCLVPQGFEFWQGRPSRLHDRIVYTRSESGWLRQRLSP